jgi:hypothetical protein
LEYKLPGPEIIRSWQFVFVRLEDVGIKGNGHMDDAGEE